MDLSNFNHENPKELYEFNKFNYLYENCDSVTINGIEYGKTLSDKLEKFALRLPDKDGKPNIETIEFDYKIDGLEFNEADFIQHEINNLNDVFNSLLEKLNKQYEKTFSGTNPSVLLSNRRNTYLNYLNSLKPPKKAITEEEEKKEMHNHIFKGNAFEVFKYLFDDLDITESSRTDVKFIYEEMKKESLIFKSVNQKTFLDWISDTYQIVVQKTSNHSRTKERLKSYAIAKQLYKK